MLNNVDLGDTRRLKETPRKRKSMFSGGNGGDQQRAGTSRERLEAVPEHDSSIPTTIIRAEHPGAATSASRSISAASTAEEDVDHDSIAAREFRDAQAQLLFVFPELKESLQTERRQSAAVMDRKTGVLWKRRDVFKNRWRPRWFALNPGQGVLTYYLLTSNDADMAPGSSEFSDAQTPPRGSATRNRATSWDSLVSAVSENTVDYDVVPRGTIYLLGCTVTVNDALSKPNESLYAFTIRPPASAEAKIHLAARTAEAREQWVNHIDSVCRAIVGSPRSSSSISNGPVPIVPPPPPPLHNTRPPRPVPFRLRTPPRHLRLRDEAIPEEDLEGLDPDDVDALLDSVVEPNVTAAWTSLGGDASSALANVPQTLTEQIAEKFRRYLPLCDDDGESVDWKPLFFSHETGHQAFQHVDASGRSIVKSVAVLNRPPKQILSLLLDIGRRQDYETNVRANERMKVVNPHTFLDYYSYNAVRCKKCRFCAPVVRGRRFLSLF